MPDTPLTNRLLFVCLGNICRSPMAEGVFRARATERGLAEAFEIDSAGMGAWHIGNPPDRRAQNAAAARGIDISAQRARQVTVDDFAVYGRILAMDQSNLDALGRLSPAGCGARVELAMRYARMPGLAAVQEVPDPYFGGEDGFTHVLDLLEVMAEGLLDDLSGRR